MGWGFRTEPKTGSFPAEGWLFIIGTLARLERNGGFFRADYAIPWRAERSLFFCMVRPVERRTYFCEARNAST